MVLRNDRPGAVVVGTSFGLFVHVRALRDAGFDVRAIVGRDLAKARERAALMGIPHASNDLDAVLTDPAIRLVTVATPPHTHHDIVMRAIKAGRNVVCEKPFARDLAQAREMLRAAESAGVLHMFGSEFRFGAIQATLRRVVQSGAIGEPLMFRRTFQQSGGDPHEAFTSWWTDAGQGGGWLGGFGTHMIDQARYAVGEITAVSAILRTLSPLRPGMTSDDYYNVQFRTQGGCQGVIESSLAFPGPLLVSTRVAGTEGTAWIQPPASRSDPEEVWIQSANGERHRVEVPAELANATHEPFPVAELIQTEMDRWHMHGFYIDPYAKLFGKMKAAMDGRPDSLPESAADFRDGAANQAVLDAVRRSAAERRWVEVESV